MNIVIIGNPIASGGRAEEKIRDLDRILTARGHRVEACLTRYAGHGRRMAATLEPGTDRVIAVGGDGTLNEIASGMAEGTPVPLLQLPSGNANLLARDLGLPRTAEETARLAEQGTLLRADLGFMNGRAFLLVAGAGFDARVTEELKKRRRGRVGNLSYAIPVVRALKDPPRDFRVRVDGGPPVSGAMAVVSKVRNYAGLFDLAFRADVASGLLDVIVFPSDSPLFLARCAAAAALGPVTRVAGVTYLRGRTVEIRSTAPLPVQLDGDFAGYHPAVDIRLEPGRIPLVGPASR